MGSLFGGGGGSIPMPTDIFKVNKKTGQDLTGKQVAGLERYYGQALPSTMKTMAQYGPQFMQQGFGFGQQGLTGLMGLQQQAGAGAAQQMADLRAQELGAMTGQTGLFRGLAESLSPEQAGEVARMQRLAQLGEQEVGAYGQRSQDFLGKYGIGTEATDTASQMAQQMAQEAYARRGTLSPEEQRMAQQSAREASAASGRIGGSGAIASEILNREQAMAARRAEAAQMAGQSSALGRQAAEQRLAGFGQMQDVERTRANLRGMAGEEAGRAFTAAGQFYTQPGLSMLGSTPSSYGAGSSLAAAGLGLGQSMTPQLDYNLGLNLARERASAIDARNMAQYQADQQAAASKMGLIGTIAGIAAAPFTGGASLGLAGLGSMLGGGGGGGLMSAASPMGQVNYRYI